MVSIALPFSLTSNKLNKMKFWQKRKKLEISDTDHVYKVIYLGNIITNWAKGESTLEKPLTTLWKNYCNNYANYYSKNGNNSSLDSKKSNQSKLQSKQILMKLTICNQGLKVLTREFGVNEYWANRITFCGQSSNFPRVFVWIYRHEGKRFKQELRVHACLVNKQVSVSKMITALQARLSYALDEFKREQKLKENARRISLMRDQIPLFDDSTPSYSDEFDEMDYPTIGKHADNESEVDELSQLSITSGLKNNPLHQIYRHLSQGSLTSIRSKSSTSSSRKSIPIYEPNHTIPLRKKLLLKGSKNFKEPLERTRSAPRLGSILEELSSEEEDNFFGENVTFDESFSFTEEQFAADDSQAEGSADGDSNELSTPESDTNVSNEADNQQIERLIEQNCLNSLETLCQNSDILACLTRPQTSCRSAEQSERVLCEQFQHILLDQRAHHLNQCDS